MSLKTHRSGNMARGLAELAEWIPAGSSMVEIGSYRGESANIFAQSGNLASIVCVDAWHGPHYSQGEPAFDQVAALWTPLITKRKAAGLDAAKTFKAQSLDFVYIDADHSYDAVRADIDAWNTKVRAGGLIGGHDYCHAFPGVIRAVSETFGIPERVFPDSSWLVKIPRDNVEIVTYCSRNFSDCLRLHLPTWSQHAGAQIITIYSDCDDLQKLVPPPQEPKIQFRTIHKDRNSSPTISWNRKIDCLQHAARYCQTEFMLWLDTDCVTRRPVRPLFDCLGRSAHVAAGRLIGRTNRAGGAANAGVIAFRFDPCLETFFKDWQQRSAELGKTGEKWHEQKALSALVMSAFDGLHPYRGAVFSEQLWNSEHDDDAAWLMNLEKYQPGIVHYKGNRWANKQLREAVAKVLK
jgi:hypothetical protein